MVAFRRAGGAGRLVAGGERLGGESSEAGGVDEPTGCTGVGQWCGPRADNPGPRATNDGGDRDTDQVSDGGEQGGYYQTCSYRGAERNDQPGGGGPQLPERD